MFSGPHSIYVHYTADNRLAIRKFSDTFADMDASFRMYEEVSGCQRVACISDASESLYKHLLRVQNHLSTPGSVSLEVAQASFLEQTIQNILDE